MVELSRKPTKDFFLDFAIYCLNGKINVETDGTYWHDNRERASIDRPRDNALETAGWRVLRFDDLEIREKWPNIVCRRLQTILIN